jgi:alpha-methylacyl-CoA racemase
MTDGAAPSGPLTGVRVLEFAGIGPGPFCTMLLSDMGADVVRIDRRGAAAALPIDVTSRGRVSIELDLKRQEDRDACLEAIAKADVLIEGYRPGVMERLGLGPKIALELNPRLIYGRMTGWGQSGPIAHTAGHDINYIAVTGALAAMGAPDRPPVPPLNLLGDFGGGALYLAMGIAAALFERERSGRGQVIDAAMVDGVASLMALYSGLMASDPEVMTRGRHPLTGAAPNYRCYECADGAFVAIGALEPHFHARLLAKLGAPYQPPSDNTDRSPWDEQVAALTRIFKTRTRDEWRALLEDEDTCFAPVLTLAEAPDHPQMAARNVFLKIDGVVQPSPSPRFSRTPSRVQGPAPAVGSGGLARLRAWGAQIREGGHGPGHRAIEAADMRQAGEQA